MNKTCMTSIIHMVWNVLEPIFTCFKGWISKKALCKNLAEVNQHKLSKPQY